MNITLKLPQMKSLNLSVFLILLSGFAFSQQDNFKMGMQYFESGNYRMADSLLTMQLRAYPTDINALFNRGVARLYRGDTCGFCSDMFALNSPIDRDKQAVELSLAFCGDADTTFYDKKLNILEDGKIKYYKVVFHYSCSDKIIGKWYAVNKYFEAASISGNFEIKDFRTNCFASFQLDDEGNEIYVYTDQAPKFKRPNLTLDKAIAQSPYLEKLQLDILAVDTTFYINFIVDKSGKAHSPKVYVRQPNSDKSSIIKNPSPYFDSLVESLPPFQPASIRNKKDVSCRVKGIIRF